MEISSKQSTDNDQANISLRTVKKLKQNVRVNGGITREPESGRL